MISSKKNLVPAALAIVAFAWNSACADMGNVWVEKVTSDSITINWTDPTGIHRLYHNSPHYRICWEPEDPYHNTYPNITSECETLFRGSDKPFTIAGLDPVKYYRIKVETDAERRITDGEWINPKFRQVGLVRQKTLGVPVDHSLRVTATSKDNIAVEFVQDDPTGFDKIRLAYKKKWCSEHLIEVAGDALRPSEEWIESNSLRGWVDLYPESVLRTTFYGLDPDQKYEIAVFGHKIGRQEGTYLGRATAETAGFQPFAIIWDCLAADHQDILDAYARRISAAHGRRGLFDILSGNFPSLIEDRDFVLKDEGDDLTDDLTLVLFLISVRPGILVYWQLDESNNSGVRLEDYLNEVDPYLIERLKRELELPPVNFVRGDANTDQVVDLSDGVRIVDFLFRGNREIYCLDSADTNDDGRVDISDAVHLLDFLFMNGEEPAEPFRACGIDQTDDDSLRCDEFHNCAS